MNKLTILGISLLLGCLEANSNDRSINSSQSSNSFVQGWQRSQSTRKDAGGSISLGQERGAPSSKLLWQRGVKDFSVKPSPTSKWMQGDTSRERAQPATSSAIGQRYTLNEHQRLTLIKAFAPLVKFHPDEDFFPTSVDNLLEGATLKRIGEINGRKIIQTLSTDIYSQEGRDSLGNYRGRDSQGVYIDFRSEPGFKKGDALIPYPANPYTRTKYESPAPCYGQLLVKADGGIVIFYAFVYSYNGPTIGPDTRIGGIGYHNGDIEYIYVHLKRNPGTENAAFNVNNYALDRVFFSHHGGRRHGYFKDAAEVEVVKDEAGNGIHPVVYASRYGHASHVSSTPAFRIKTFDWTSNSGPVWRTWKTAIDAGDPDNPRPGWKWMNFGGRWGAGGPEDFEWRRSDKQLHNATTLTVAYQGNQYQAIKQGNDTLKDNTFTLKGKILKRADKICWQPMVNNTMPLYGISFDVYQKQPLSKDRIIYERVGSSPLALSEGKACVPVPQKGQFKNLYLTNFKMKQSTQLPQQFIIKIYSQEY